MAFPYEIHSAGQGNKLYRLALWIMHLSFVVILCGGITTHFCEKQGYIHLRTGETCHEFLLHNPDSSYTPSPLPFYLTLNTFQIKQGADNHHSDYLSHVCIKDKHNTDTTTISMNRPLLRNGYRIIQASYDTDGKGTHLGVIHDPWGFGTVLVGFALFLAASAYILYIKGISCLRHNNIGTIGLLTPKNIITIVVTSLLMLLPLTPLLITPLQPILQTPLLYIHVGTIMLSYALLIVSMIWRRLQYSAVILLAMGIVFGSFWGSISWGTYWSWDPKETWALITLLLYALPLHKRFVPALQTHWTYRIYSLICLSALLITYLGVNIFMQSKHSYL